MNEQMSIMEAGPEPIPMWDVFRWPIEAVIRTPYRFGVSDAYFCVEDDTSFNSNCGDSYSVRKYELKIGYSVEPTGVIQQIGSKARFGLMEFKSSSEGARMLVSAGSRAVDRLVWYGSRNVQYKYGSDGGCGAGVLPVDVDAIERGPL